MTVAGIMYKRMGVSNTDLALYTSWLYLPWVIKPFWSPIVDILKTKRWWIVVMQLLIGAGLAGISFSIPAPVFFQATMAFLWLLAFSSATHDIAVDGFYMLGLTTYHQSCFVGIRSTFYRIAMIAGQGLLVMVAGWLEAATGLPPAEFTIQAGIQDTAQVLQTDTSHTAHFEVSPAILFLPLGSIPADSATFLKQFAVNSNINNGFIEKPEESAGQTANFSAPSLAGNVGLVAIQLSEPPVNRKEIVLNTNQIKGDKNISLIAGERVVFTSDNWNQPAYVAVQIDPKLKEPVQATFRGLSGNIPFAWSVTFIIASVFFLLLAIYHQIILPRPETASKQQHQSLFVIFKEFAGTFVSFFRKKGIVPAIAFLLLYRLGEAQLAKMASPFMLDIREAGGLGLSTGTVGFIYGTLGIIALVVGGIAGGMAIAWKGLRFWLFPMMIAINLPDLVYVYLSYTQPGNLWIINCAVIIEQFGYGFGFTAYLLFMIYISDGAHKTAHYAICTAFMALGMMLPGMAAGWLQEIIGYEKFFVWVMICTLPAFFLLPFLRIGRQFGLKGTASDSNSQSQ